MKIEWNTNLNLYLKTTVNVIDTYQTFDVTKIYGLSLFTVEISRQVIINPAFVVLYKCYRSSYTLILGCLPFASEQVGP